MSLIKTLAQVAIGVAATKKAKEATAPQAEGGLAGLLGGLAGGGTDAAGSILGGLLGGGQAAAGGLQDLLGGLAGDGAAGAGGLLAGLTGALNKPAESTASFGSVLNSAFAQTPEPEIEPSADQEAAAALMLRAMIQAAKSDGTLDDAERDKLLGQLGDDVDSEEAAFVQAELQSPVDVDGLVAQVPAGMEQQIYAVSVLGIDLDSQAEAQYLDQFSKALRIDPKVVNQIHEQLGEPPLYT